MLSERESIILADCEPGELRIFSEGLGKNGRKYIIKSYPANQGRTGMISEIRRYMNYFLVSFRYFLARGKYDEIICWQQFYALIIGFYCNIFRVKKRNRVVALNYTYKEKKKLRKLYQWFMKKCLSGGYVDYLHVPSTKYGGIISRQFDYPFNRIIVAVFGIDDTYEKYQDLLPPEQYVKNGYMVAIGRSNRDYKFLIDAWKSINYPLAIISDTFKGKTDNPNISIRNDISGEAQYPWLINCKAVIIPIDDGNICSGDTVLLKGMSYGKIVLVTKPSTLAEMYVGGQLLKRPQGSRQIRTDSQRNYKW